ncbi:hypothetical protein [Neobacillus niacini]|uniref:hypothetical protein n=1 Tax=Neobacillus niacini TaxID=86668 RepID=UPI000B2DA40E|nr:hypothetical protein [Neobacillus niacini]
MANNIEHKIRKWCRKMNDWMIIYPKGIMKSPNDTIYENFQVLGFVIASTKEAALGKLKENYPYLNGSGFDEVWIYQLRTRNPHITYLGIDNPDDNFEDDFEKEMVHKITCILKENGYSNITYDYYDENSYFFEAYSDAFHEVL